MMRLAGFSALLLAGMMSVAAPAQAQGSMNTIKKPVGNAGCPSGWRDRPKDVSMTKAGYDTCYPDTGAKKAYVRKTQGEACASGYIGSGSYYCIEGQVTYTASTAGALIKAHPLDRCPVGYFTVPKDGNACTTIAANPPKVRRKGDGECGPGELEDWGVYCVSDYDKLARKDAAKGTLDYNGIYQNSYRLTGKQQASHMAALPEGTEYTPAYLLIFGRVDRDGNPFPGGAGAGAGAAVSNAANTGNPVTAATDAVKAECKVPAPAKKRGLGGLGAALNQAVAAVAGEAGC
jgi:hypothetical protein